LRSSRFFFRWRRLRHNHCQKSMSEKCQCDVSIPGDPLSDLIMIEANFTFGGFKPSLDGPSLTGGFDHFLE